jgi:hypothetical protein
MRPADLRAPSISPMPIHLHGSGLCRIRTHSRDKFDRLPTLIAEA